MKTRLDIAMAVPGLPFDGDALQKQALGGSETAAIYMAKHLQRAGADVLVFCNTEKQMLDDAGVRYLPLGAWPMYARGTQHDVSIIQRQPQLMSPSLQTRLNVMWCHDMASGRMSNLFRSALWTVDFSFVLSEWMRQQYMQVYALDESAFRVTRNGIDASLFSREAPRQRDRFHLVYSARPERGLDVLLERIMPRLIARDSRYHLTVCGYENPVEHWAEFYKRCDRAMAALGPGKAVRAGSLTKVQLYKLYESAGVYSYPTPSLEMPTFVEISCISAMEAQAAGLPIVTSHKGALPETIKEGAGTLLQQDPASDAYCEAFTNAVHTYATDDQQFSRASEIGRGHGRQLDWKNVATSWLELFEKEIRTRNGDADRAVRHMHRVSDIVAAKDWLRDRPEDFKDLARIKQLLAPWDFMDQPDGYRVQYERIGATHEDYVYDSAPREPRFALCQRWLEEHRDDVKSALDYGCAHGAYAIGLAKNLPHLSVHGVDIDHFSTDMAAKWAEKLGVADRAKFDVWTHDSVTPAGELVDCAILQEVLEHVPEPWAVAESVERQVKKGGYVYITVPYGPWEYSSYHNYPWRCHIWHFDKHDLQDMFGDKKELVIDSYHQGDIPELSTPAGWWIVSYRADHEPCGQVDLKRKRWLARPRHTVSVAIIAGGSSVIETMMWTLRSLYHVGDEIVISDCGLPAGQFDSAMRILDESEPIARWREKVRLVPGIDPRVDGFERSRNMALDACVMDFVLWIDTDERLLMSTNIHKYLRANYYHGYGIRQHHLSCDVAMTPDMPVRLFRRTPYRDGRSMRFFGCLHEHPELEMNSGPGPIVVLSDVHIAHLGYLVESTRQQRFVRNFPLLQMDEQKHPERLLQKFFLMRDKVQIARFEIAQNGGKVTSQIKALMREVIELGRKHFVGKGNYMNSDALAYYSEALGILGEGFHATFSIEADQGQSKPNGLAQYRFANKEDFMAEFTRRAAEKIDPLLGEYF